MSKSIFILISLLLSGSLEILAQKSVKLSGRVSESGKSESLPFTQVVLFQPGGDVPVIGTETDLDGRFILVVPSGTYDLAISFVGYADKRMKGLAINRDMNIGEITLVPSGEQLEEVVIEGEAIRRPITTDIEGILIRPDQTISNNGGSLLDVLRNTPSVNVSQDGTVTVRGSDGTNVLIDGRNSALAADLDQIPASSVESIKIINNPNAKYDAEGAGGVINIKLKRNKELGTKGSAEFTIGSQYRLNSAVRASHKTEKLNLYAGYSYRDWYSVGKAYTERLTYSDNELLAQKSTYESDDMEHTVNYGGEYFKGKSRFGYEGAFNTESEQIAERKFTTVTDLTDGSQPIRYSRVNDQPESDWTVDNAITFLHGFSQKDRELKGYIGHSIRENHEERYIDVYSGTLNPAAETPNGQERSFEDESRQTAVAQVDYVHPIGDHKVEIGLKGQQRSIDNTFRYEILDQPSGEWRNQVGVSNRFDYEEAIYAAYLIYTRSLGKVTLSAGSRLEQTNVESRLITTDEVNKQDYLNLFPSAQALYEKNERNTFKATYSRRIDRPRSGLLNPFPDIADSLNIRRGNPNLRPEYINSFELGHKYIRKKWDLTTNLFYRHVDGELDRIIVLEDGISYRQPANLLSSETYGAELIGTGRPREWWNLTGSISLFQINVDGSNLGSAFSNSGFAWNAKLTTDFTLPKKVALQLTGNYTAPEVESQGKDLARYYVDASLQRSFWDKKMSLSATVQDVFNIRRFAGVSSGEDFRQEFEFKPQSRIFLMTAKFSF